MERLQLRICRTALALAAWLLAGTLAAPAQQKAPEASATELAFWNSIKDTADPEELKAYLEAFPQGAFAALARLRLEKLEQQRRAAGMAPRPPAASLDEATVREVQERLYNLNYAITSISGRITPEVTDAVRILQGRLGEAMTGELTEAQVAKLRRIEPPKKWGAIAALKSGRFEVVWQLPTRREAEATLLVACNAGGSPQCRMLTIADRQCAAAAVARETGADGKPALRVTISRQIGLGPAQAAALGVCNRGAGAPNRCRIASRVCADGSHVQAQPPKPDGAL